MKALFTIVLISLAITGCSKINDPCRGINQAPAAPRGSININGWVYGVNNKDTISLSSSEVRIVYISGFDTDCGIHYQEIDTITTDSSGFFQMSDRAYDHCGYYYEISRYGYHNISVGIDGNYETAGVLCPGSLDGFKVYLEKN